MTKAVNKLQWLFHYATECDLPTAKRATYKSTTQSQPNSYIGQPLLRFSLLHLVENSGSKHINPFASLNDGPQAVNLVEDVTTAIQQCAQLGGT
jgi:hypothetical protein